MSGDAYHITAPPEDGDGALSRDASGARRRRASRRRTSTTSTRTAPRRRINDATETLAIKRVFGEHAYKLAMSSTKSMTGHLLGAAGGLEAGISALAIHHSSLPPTINLDNPDADCDLDYVPNVAREADVTYALSNSFGFGGTNAALVFKKFDVIPGEGTAHEDRRLSQARRDARRRRARRRGADLDPRSGRQLRAERAGRLRARRGAAAQGEARRRGDRVSAGPARVTQALREALARGADRAIHVEARRWPAPTRRWSASRWPPR